MSTVASASQGANRLLQACLAQPGEDRFRCTSPGRSPIQYSVDRWPIGYDACVCSTSFGRAVVPDVKYRSSVSEARVTPSGENSTEGPAASPDASQPSTAEPTAIRVYEPATPAHLPVSAERTITCFAL